MRQAIVPDRPEMAKQRTRSAPETDPSGHRLAPTDEQIEQTARTRSPKEQARIQQLEHRITQAVSAGKGSELSTQSDVDRTLNEAQAVDNATVAAEPGSSPTVQMQPASGSPQDPATGVEESFVPTDITDPAANLARVQQIVEQSTKFYADHPKFTCRITRKERVNGKLMPQETMAMNFRLTPRSVYYKWLDEENAGREMVYVEGKYDGKIITLGGRNDFLMTGKRIKVDPGGFLARKNGRYSIADSGMDRMMERLAGQLARQARGDFAHGTIRFMGTVTRKENDGPLDYVTHVIPKGVDPAFPDGGHRHWYFDQKYARLVLLHADDLKGEFLEYYLFDRFLTNPALEDQDFDPDLLWPKPTKTASAEPVKPVARLVDRNEVTPK